MRWLEARPKTDSAYLCPTERGPDPVFISRYLTSQIFNAAHQAKIVELA